MCSANCNLRGARSRTLLIEAIRYGEQPEVRAHLTSVMDNVLDKAKLRDLLEEHALAHDSMDVTRVRKGTRRSVSAATLLHATFLSKREQLQAGEGSVGPVLTATSGEAGSGQFAQRRLRTRQRPSRTIDFAELT
jgi:hypothetical protein